MADEDDEKIPPPPNLRRYYGRELDSISAGSWTFRVRVLRGGRTVPLEIGSLVTSLQWADDSEATAGSITLRRTSPHAPVGVGIGHAIALDVRSANRWYTLWTMRCGEPEVEIGAGESTETVELTDDLWLLSLDRRDWKFRKTKKRGRGWYAHEITREIASTVGLRVGNLARGRREIRSLVKENATALEVLVAAWKEEKEETRARYVVRIRGGRLEVVPLRRNQTLYVIRRQWISATPTQTRKAKPVTILTGKGTIGKGKARRTVKHREARERIVARFGRQEKEKDYGRVDDEAELRRKVREDYARELKVKRTADLSLPGMPLLRRGDGARWVTREPGWRGGTEDTRDRSFVYATKVGHDLSPGEFTTEITVTQEDPYERDALRRAKELREQARSRRKKRRAGKGSGSG